MSRTHTLCVGQGNVPFNFMESNILATERDQYYGWISLDLSILFKVSKNTEFDGEKM